MAAELVFGLHAVRALLERDPAGVLALWVQDSRTDDEIQTIVGLASRVDVRAQRAPRKTLDRLAGDGNHQGVVVRYRGAKNSRTDFSGFVDAMTSNPLLLVLDGVQDPRNLGACLRSADAAGVEGVIQSKNRSVTVTAAVRKTAAGAAETVPVVEVSNLARSLAQLRDRGVQIVGAAGEATTSLYDADLTGSLAFVLGGEENGLRRLTREHCDRLVRIPMHGRVESLNVSVAAALCLYEALRQRDETAAVKKTH